MEKSICDFSKREMLIFGIIPLSKARTDPNILAFVNENIFSKFNLTKD
jgi:GTP-dependent phosphoenolpyruvate carboxykinase